MVNLNICLLIENTNEMLIKCEDCKQQMISI